MPRLALAAAAVAALTLAPAAASADAGITAVYETTPDKLWDMVDFHQPSEVIMPPIASSAREGEGVGATKVNTLADGGGDIHLLLAYYAPEERAFNYTIQEGPLPVTNYVGQVRVTEAGEGRAALSWQGTYDAAGVPEDKADEILGGFYASIAERIGETYERVE
ncbi:SRPBCC family protein [Caenispirillum salinarum]|uniref:SRPBCC family protein n=1 Tax=Caenispirillum salinarum TaxID=859058 RepID=UPI00384F3670